MCAIINIIKTVFLHVKDKNKRLQEACKTGLQIQQKVLFLKIFLPNDQIFVEDRTNIHYITRILTKQENLRMPLHTIFVPTKNHLDFYFRGKYFRKF